MALLDVWLGWNLTNGLGLLIFALWCQGIERMALFCFPRHGDQTIYGDQ